MRQGRLKNIWSPVCYTQEVLNQNHATDLLHEMVDKETPRAFTAVGVLTTHYENNQNKEQKNESRL